VGGSVVYAGVGWRRELTGREHSKVIAWGHGRLQTHPPGSAMLVIDCMHEEVTLWTSCTLEKHRRLVELYKTGHYFLKYCGECICLT